MSDLIAPQKTVRFTIIKAPQRTAQKKTIQRLMRMQQEIRRGLKDLAKRRRQKDNKPTRRAGQIWINRATATKLTRVEAGATFTLEITPQIIPDLKSVEQFLSAEAA